jgi:hypothetical protein
MLFFMGMEITLCNIPIIITHINNYVHHGNGNFSSITMEFPGMVSSSFPMAGVKSLKSMEAS